MRRIRELIRRYKMRCRFDEEHSHHRRGEYETLGWGLSFGGGRIYPGWIKNSAGNDAAMADLMSDDDIRTLIEFADGKHLSPCWFILLTKIFIPAQFAKYFPAIYDDFSETLERVVDNDPKLSVPIPGCAWAATHINFPPGSWCHAHTDHLNHVGGLCAVWALDEFNADKGGHIILWDLKLVVRFPPGNLILLPSALVKHGNISVYQGGKRSAFVLFSAAGLFRWVLNGMMSDAEFKESASAEDLKAWQEFRASQAQRNTERFPLWDDLVKTFAV